MWDGGYLWNKRERKKKGWFLRIDCLADILSLRIYYIGDRDRRRLEEERGRGVGAEGTIY